MAHPNRTKKKLKKVLTFLLLKRTTFPPLKSYQTSAEKIIQPNPLIFFHYLSFMVNIFRPLQKFSVLFRVSSWPVRSYLKYKDMKNLLKCVFYLLNNCHDFEEIILNIFLRFNLIYWYCLFCLKVITKTFISSIYQAQGKWH